MSELDVTAPANVERQIAETVATDNIRVDGIMFLFADESMAAELVYGIGSGGAFDPRRRELWVLTGPPLKTILTMAPVGTTRLQVLRDMVADIVDRVQTTPGLKQQLLDDGNLRIVNRSLIEVLV